MKKILIMKKFFFFLSFWKALIFRFLKSLSAVSLRSWTSISVISWRNWVWVDRNLFCLIMTIVIISIEMIDKRFEVISIFELQTRDQLDWFALQFEKMLTYYRFSYFNQMIWIDRFITYWKINIESTMSWHWQWWKNEKIEKWHDIQFS